ncbi:thiamine phosphate synthase [Paenibacillus abyssi]|uniref:Thiamine-phosphate synthase n=1 Tax=Paenibacillus abyssi TaxID=1340531 RepID=A0A917CZT9_9BACL|nr:thiamine phosphate synthase [Paenibacillus abyssi]GGG03703.1 thiamine-phosphate synthase [Paenibacillus abyssi]
MSERKRIDARSTQELLKVYLVMGSPNCTKNPVFVLEEAIKGGITLFQFREKGEGSLADRSKYALGKELMQLCRQHRIPFIVNDDVDLAVALDADGVHIGQEDEPVEAVRCKIGNKMLGVSAHTYEEALSAAQQGADYLGLGPIYPTQTKSDAKSVQGLSLIQELRGRGLMIPIVGIGGITAENAGAVMKAGADGVAVVTAISQSERIEESTKLLRDSVIFC